MVVVSWCGERGCADEIEKVLDASILGTDSACPMIPQEGGTCMICGQTGKPTILSRSY
jgi:hypothetical protein